MVADPSNVPLHGQGPLPLDVDVAVDAGRDPGGFEPLDAWAGSTVLVERGVVPEDVERLAANPEPRSVLQGAVELGQLASGRGDLPRVGRLAGIETCTPRVPQTTTPWVEIASPPTAIIEASASGGSNRRRSTRRHGCPARGSWSLGGDRSRRGPAGDRGGSGPSKGRQGAGPDRPDRRPHATGPRSCRRGCAIERHSVPAVGPGQRKVQVGDRPEGHECLVDSGQWSASNEWSEGKWSVMLWN